MIELAYALTFLFISYISFCTIIYEAHLSPYKEIFFIICLFLNLRFYYFFISIFTIPDSDSKEIFLVQLLKSYLSGENILFYLSICLVFFTLYIYYYYIRSNPYNQYHWFVVYDYAFYIQYWYFMLYLSSLSWVSWFFTGLYELTIIKILIHFKFLHDYADPFIFLALVKIFLCFFFPEATLEDVLILFIIKIFPFAFTTVISIIYFTVMIFSFDNCESNFSRIQSLFIIPNSIKNNIKIKNISLLYSDYLTIIVFMHIFTGIYWTFVYNVYGEVSGLAFILAAFGISTPSAYFMSLSLERMQKKYLLFNLIPYAAVLITVKEFL